jgi:hypothetical protein
MRTISILCLVPGLAIASGTIVNSEPEPSAVKVHPPPHARLLQIDSELRALDSSTPTSEVFTRSVRPMMPILALSATPMVAVGFVFGVLKAESNIKQTADHPPDFVGVTAAAAAGIFLVGALITFSVGAFAVFDHWAQRAAGAFDRAQRARELRTEQRELSLRL